MKTNRMLVVWEEIKRLYVKEIVAESESFNMEVAFYIGCTSVLKILEQASAHLTTQEKITEAIKALNIELEDFYMIVRDKFDNLNSD